MRDAQKFYKKGYEAGVRDLQWANEHIGCSDEAYPCGERGCPRCNKKAALCFAVVYSNYFPREVDSIWSTRDKAESRACQVGQEWHVVEWEFDKV